MHDLEAIAATPWDVVVIGAGPAGSMAARSAARRGAETLLIEKEAFPRAKVCGCCVNAAAASLLECDGMPNLLSSLSAIPLAHFRLVAGGREAGLELRGGFSVSRAQLDAGLVSEARGWGAKFIDGVAARIHACRKNYRRVELMNGAGSVIIKASVVVGASGLAGTSFVQRDEFPVRASTRSLIGANAIIESEHAGDFPSGTIRMNCAAGGYVGIVRLEDGTLNFAAALDPLWLRESGGMGPSAARVFEHAGAKNALNLTPLDWRGTPALTRRAVRPFAERFLAAGDAAGYEEPFTGEGIAWALETGMAAGKLAACAAEAGWSQRIESEWAGFMRELNADRRLCRALARMLRYPAITRGVVRALEHAPILARPVIYELSRSGI